MDDLSAGDAADELEVAHGVQEDAACQAEAIRDDRLARGRVSARDDGALARAAAAAEAAAWVSEAAADVDYTRDW